MNRKVIYGDDDKCFTVKVTAGKGSGDIVIPTLPKKKCFKVDVYLKDGRTFSYIAKAKLYHYSEEEIVSETLFKISAYLFNERPDMVIFPVVRYAVVSVCYDDNKKKWECCYWSDGRSETAILSSNLINLINSYSASRTNVDLLDILRKVVSE